jgi:hypothetical protein
MLPLISPRGTSAWPPGAPTTEPTKSIAERNIYLSISFSLLVAVYDDADEIDQEQIIDLIIRAKRLTARKVIRHVYVKK